MKSIILLVFCCTTSLLGASDLAILNAYLFDLAANNEQLSPSSMLEIAAQTIAHCTNKLINKPHAYDIINRIAPELKIPNNAEPTQVASALAQLILDNPTHLQILYTLTQLTQASINAPPEALLEDNANMVVLEVYKALEPFLKQQRKKRLIFWLWFGGGIALGLCTIGLLHKFYKHHQQTTGALEQMQATLVAQTAKIDALTNTPQPVPDLIGQHRQVRESVQIQNQMATLQNQLAQTQAANARGVKIIHKKLENQRQVFDESYKVIEAIVDAEIDEALVEAEIDEASDAADALADLIQGADKVIELANASRKPKNTVSALRRHHGGAVKA